VTANIATLQVSEQFSSLPLHDATLCELYFDWAEKVCTAKVIAFVHSLKQSAEARQIVWHNVREVSILHHAPWGKSSQINAARVELGDIFILEMQSGDEIRIAAGKFEFRSV
jgi:hypothetical protein